MKTEYEEQMQALAKSVKTETKAFDPTKPVQTLDGREAGIDHTDGVGAYPLLGWHRCELGNKYQSRWNEHGRNIGIRGRDLVNIPEYPPLPEVQGGRLEYRGKGWTNNGKTCRYATQIQGSAWDLKSIEFIPSGGDCHYAEFIPDEPTTVRGWLETLPDGYRERALGHLSVSKAESRAGALHHAMAHAFTWGGTPEGNAFWLEVAKGNIPPLPPETKLIPYMLETFPMWAVWVRAKGNTFLRTVAGVQSNIVSLSGVLGYEEKSFQELFDVWEIAGTDGIWHPAGQEVSV